MTVLYTQNFESIREAARNQPRTTYTFERKIGQRVRLSSGAVGTITKFNKQLTWIYIDKLNAEIVGLAQNIELYQEPEQQRFI